jgi:putative PIN family toxin of toxin-antitoxin system
MLRVVLDTNVAISAHLSPEGQQALILGLAIAGYFRCFVSEALLEEYEGVLRRERFGLSPRSVTQSMRIIRKTTTLVIPKRKLDVSRDPDDNKVVECALEARADYIVTGNTRHFPSRFQGIRIVLPRQFLAVAAAQPG